MDFWDDQPIFYSIVLPIFIGAATAGLLAILKGWFFEVLVPWFVYIISSSYTVQGKWVATTLPSYLRDEKIEYDETFFIWQLSDRVWGEIFCVERPAATKAGIDTAVDGKPDGDAVSAQETQSTPRLGSTDAYEGTEKLFEFEGTFRENILTVNYWNPNRAMKGRGTFCLESVDSNSLKGCFSWYEPIKEKVCSGEYQLTKRGEFVGFERARLMIDRGRRLERRRLRHFSRLIDPVGWLLAIPIALFFSTYNRVQFLVSRYWKN